MIYIYEDELYSNFLPLVYLRPVFDLYCGRLSLLEKIRRLYPNEKIGLLTRPLLSDITKEKHPDLLVGMQSIKETSLFISARAILKEKILVDGPEQVFINKDNDNIGFRVQNSRIKDSPINIKTILNWQLPKRQIKAISVKFLWDLIELNHQELINDFPMKNILSRKILSAVFASSAINTDPIIIGNINNLYLGHNAEIEPGAVIDLRKGHVYIDDNAKILALSKIVGPAYIGKNSIIDQAKIIGATIGENCRVSGEVEASIFQGFVNKHHYGFIGHSYLGEWVNLGAGTTNSDLKNNYSSVKVKLGTKKIDTNLTKVGCFIGDHAKTAIGTMIPTGANIGIFANVLNSVKSIPNFHWDKNKRWHFQKAIQTAKVIMSRRNIELSKSYEKLIKNIY